MSGSARVWTLNVGMAALALVLFAGVVVPLPSTALAVGMPWWALAILFYLAEILVVHFQFRREVHTFSLSEIPFVIGLFFATPVDFVAANVLGAAGALVIHRRQPPIKLSFNVAQFALGAILGVVAFNLLRGETATMAPILWAAAVVATLAANLVGILTIAIAIALSERLIELRKLSQVLKFGLAVGLTNTVVVLTAVTFLWNDPAMLWILGVPAALLYLAYRAYMSEREKHESLEFLYESTTILQRTPALDLAIVDLLAHARRMFKAEIAELTLMPAGDAREALRTWLDANEQAHVMEAVDARRLADIWQRVQEAGSDGSGRGFLIRRAAHALLNRPAGAAPWPGAGGELRDGVVAPLRGDRGILGMMVVANRLGDVSTFDEDDARLLETLARHAGVALENGRLGESLNQLTELKEQLRFQAYHDSLTGLGNRALFLERVTDMCTEPRHGSGPIVLFVDLDDFKTVNDTLGHAAGDTLLAAVADRLRGCLRPTDLAARLGGDEFAIMLAGGQVEHALAIGERIIAALRAPFWIEGNEVAVRASVGIAARASSTETPDDLLRNADVAMYTAKARGKGRVALFQPEMHAAVVARHALTGRLERAVLEQQFVLQYQPVVDLESGEITGAEALVRWRQPDGSLIAPADFIPLAEDTGLIVPLGKWVLETASRQAAAWATLVPRRMLQLSVNLSARQVQHPDFIDEVAEIVDRTGLERGTLVLEITETVMMQDTRATIAKLAALKELGVQLAIDDFGTGYSSLSYLRRFPVDALKMAKPFVDTAGPNRRDWAFASAIIALGHSLHLRVVAEGIERPEQLAVLRSLGCDLGQGFYFGRPMEAGRLSALLLAGQRVEVDLPMPRRATRSASLTSPLAPAHRAEQRTVVARVN
ncbi:MAG: EAL domain-containing protein [Chloroflexota bacterium]|nr:EAL domain-containing protein [Chloroflexota bacterium]